MTSGVLGFGGVLPTDFFVLRANSAREGKGKALPQQINGFPLSVFSRKREGKEKDLSLDCCPPGPLNFSSALGRHSAFFYYF